MPLIEDDALPELHRIHLSPDEQVPQHIRTKNRRKRWLDLHHDEYFGPQLELADPLLYDRLIRRFQTPAERESEGRKKGYSGILEADLLRSEAKLDALKHPDPENVLTYKRGADGEILAEDENEIPASKEDGYARWKYIMEQRFLSGRDSDFDYQKVDESEEFDDRVLEERDAQDAWFDRETPEEAGERVLQGETGQQDF